MRRTSSDLRLNPHLHVVFLDGAYHKRDGELVWPELGHLKTSEVAEVLERALLRIELTLRHRYTLSSNANDKADASDEERSAPE